MSGVARANGRIQGRSLSFVSRPATWAAFAAMAGGVLGAATISRCAVLGVLWYPPTNRHATFAGTFEDRFADGRLVEHRGESDMESLRGQLGLSRD